uniref:CBM21 domain-containing protein n=1 Tax=Acrobeloides nanus TaxID=290746 RepID=A0A914CDV3_9BILA
MLENTPNEDFRLENSLPSEYLKNFLKNGLYSISNEDQLLPIQPTTSISVIVENPRKRKFVKFADDAGQPLATVFQYENPLYEEFLIPNWKITFEQPLSNYAKFNDRLLKNMVSLENAFILEEPYLLYGTIAALNVSKEKQVYVRFTMDSWKSYTDVMAHLFSSSTLYDIFYFYFEIPKPTTEINCIEFCLYCEINEKRIFYDNNNGNNYVIMLEMKTPEIPTLKKVTRKHKKKHHHNAHVVQCLDAINDFWKKL